MKFDGAFGVRPTLTSNRAPSTYLYAATQERRLLITDPKALHHIMQASGYTYVRSEDRKEPTRTLLGKGVLVVEGESSSLL